MGRVRVSSGEVRKIFTGREEGKKSKEKRHDQAVTKELHLSFA